MSQTQPDGYLALPEQGEGPGVLVLHAWWGLNEATKAFCDRLAKEGFTVFAPDLYHGKVVDTIPEAEQMSNALNANGNQAARDVFGAAQYLSQRAGQSGRGLAVIGFSLGAYFALVLSQHAPSLARSVVVFYGTGPDDFSKSQARYLGHFAENDPFEPLEGVDALEETLRQAGRPVSIYRYPGVGHWFFEPDRADAYDAAAAALAWERTLAFLRERKTP